MGPPLGEVHDPRGQAVRVQGDPEDVDGLRQQLGCDAVSQRRHAAVGGDHGPVLVDDQRRVGLVPAEHEPYRLAHGFHLDVVESPLPVHRRIPGREQQLVALAQGHLEALGEVEHHLRARSRPAVLDEADVAR